MVVSGCGGGATSVTPASVDGGTAIPLDDAAIPSSGSDMAVTKSNDLATTTSATDLATTTGATDLATTSGTDLAMMTGATDLAMSGGSAGDLSSAGASSADLGPSCPASPTAFDGSLIMYASDGDFLYGFEPPNIVRVPRQGGMPMIVATNVPFAFSRDVKVDDQYVYWLQDNRVGTSENVLVFRVAKTGGTPVQIAHPSFVSQYVMNDSRIFFTDGTTVSAFDKSGSAVDLVVTPKNGVHGMAAADAQFVYWTGFDGAHATIERAPVGGGAETVIATWTSNSISGSTGTALGDAQFIYLWDYGMVRRVDKASGQMLTLYDITTQKPTVGDRLNGMALDDSGFYWGSVPNDAPDLVQDHYWLSRVDKDGKNFRVLVDAPHYSRGVALAGDSVYFSESPVERICK